MLMIRLIETLATAVSSQSRKRKFRQFLELLHPQLGESILDIGVNTEEYSESDNYLEKHFVSPECITAVGLEDGAAFSKRYPRVTYQKIIADQQLPFHVNAFDIAYSNAVIEHVGDHQAQIRFLQEMYRVAKRGYLTTPNRYFPIELHTRVPLLHILLPKKIFDRFLIWIGKSWAAGGYMNCLSESELHSLCAEVGIHDFRLIRNRFFGFTMTFTLVWNKS